MIIALVASLEQQLSTLMRLSSWAVRPYIQPRDFVPPRKALIFKPCCLSQVLLATPLLGVLKKGYPEARFDWAVSDWARPAVAANPEITQLIDTGRVGRPDSTIQDVRELIEVIREGEYDTCFLPGRSVLPALIAWRAEIPQRIGLDVNQRGAFHTTRVVVEPSLQTGEAYLALAEALGLESQGSRMAFYPSDAERNAAFARLTDELGWDGQKPLAVLHPGGGRNPVRDEPDKRWPIERFALLGNYLVREKGALVLIAGGEDDVDIASGVAGIMSVPAFNAAGQISLGELGAICELASVYVGNDAGTTHVAVAVGCKTVVIYGPNDATYSKPFAPSDNVIALWEPYEGEFAWEKGVSLAQVRAAVEGLLAY